jgi:dTDP-L-rhamnose 4-epimerase
MAEQVLVTGGAGFIGAHTVAQLLRQGHAVRVLDNLSTRVHADDRPPSWLPACAEFRHGDVRDPEALRGALDGVGLVVHLAAYQDYLPDLATFFDVNVTGTARLYEAIVGNRLTVKKVVVASSQSVYGEGRHRCDEHGLVTAAPRDEQDLAAGNWDVNCTRCGRLMHPMASEEEFASPTNAYGASKLAQEQVALTLGRRYGIPTTCFRYSITNGRWQSPRNAYSGVCRIFVQEVLNGRPPVLYEDGRQWRDYCAVADVVDANLRGLQDSRTDFEVYNVGGGDLVTVRDYAQLVLDVLGSDIGFTVPGIYRYGDSRHAISSTAKLQALGWRASTPLRDVVADYVDWYREEANRWSPEVVRTAMRTMIDLGVLRGHV